MKIAVASKIRNEIDIIEPFLRHLDSLFDKVYLLDHKSKDGTTEILKNAVQQRPDWEYIYVDFNGHFHKQVSNAMMEKAFADDADFLFTLDADEFLPFKDRNELELALNRLAGFDGVGAFQWKNCIPCDFGNRMFTPKTKVWYPSYKSNFSKVVVPRTLYEKSNHSIYITQGSHHVCDAQNRYVDTLDLGALVHVPIRSREQAEKKTIIKCIAYLAIENRNSRDGFHNFEMLSKISNNELNDETLRGFTFLYEQNRAIVDLSTQDLIDRGYSQTTLNELAIPFSKSLNITSTSSSKSENSVIADALLNWKEEDPNNSDFVLNGNVMQLIPRTDASSHKTNLALIYKNSFNETIKFVKSLIPARSRSFVVNNKYRKQILDSKLFNADWYFEQYPDLRESGMDPIVHYLMYGSEEGRNPGPDFDANRYWLENSDVRESRTNPLLHYINFGKIEGRKIYPVDRTPVDAHSEWNKQREQQKDLFVVNPLKTLANRAEQIKTIKDFIKEKSFDIVICVHNALPDVKKCLESVLPTLRVNDKIILVDDQSDLETKVYLQKVLSDQPAKVKLIETPEQSYYAKSASIGLAASKADFTILLNSDTVVSPNWSEKLAYLAYLDPKIGIVGPISNAANLQSIPSIEKTDGNTAINQLPSGFTVETINNYCEDWANQLDFPVVPFVHGFCLCIKKEVKQTIGLFDTVTFPKGYGEETDYCFRAEDAGFKMALATNTFIYHAKSKSYTADIRKELMKDTYVALLGKHSQKRVSDAHKSIHENQILKDLRELSKEIFK